MISSYVLFHTEDAHQLATAKLKERYIIAKAFVKKYAWTPRVPARGVIRRRYFTDVYNKNLIMLDYQHENAAFRTERAWLKYTTEKVP